jgi:hypothetical protein
MEDDDVDARSWEDLAFQAKALRDFEPNERQRRRGSVGKAWKNLAKLAAEISRQEGSAEDRIRIDQELWQLNETLGAGKFPWRAKTAGRPMGSTKEPELDNELIKLALKSLNKPKKTVSRPPEHFVGHETVGAGWEIRKELTPKDPVYSVNGVQCSKDDYRRIGCMIDEASKKGSIEQIQFDPSLMLAIRKVVARAVRQGLLRVRQKGTHEKRLLRKLRNRVNVDARSWEDLAFQAKGLPDFEPNQRRRQQGSMGNSLKKLAKLKAEISRRDGSPEDRIRISTELRDLNDKLGGFKFPSRPRTAGRPKGSTKEPERDDELIKLAFTTLNEPKGTASRPPEDFVGYETEGAGWVIRKALTSKGLVYSVNGVQSSKDDYRRIARTIDEASEKGSIGQILFNPRLMLALRKVVARAVEQGLLLARQKRTHEKRLLRRLRKRVMEPE